MVFEYFDKLGAAFGPSGREQAVREVIASYAAPYVDEISTDTMGNLICCKKGTGHKVMLAAHMDTIGVVATYIDEQGFIRFSQIGGLFHGDLIHVTVRFANGTRGVISYEEKTRFSELTQAELFIDIGATDKEHAQQMVQVGDFAVLEAQRFTQNGILCGPYLDNRIGCVALLLAMQQLIETNNTLYFVFTTQEEVGLRGAAPAAFAIAPDYGIAVDVTDTGDLPERKYPMAVKMGAGPAIKLMDHAALCSPIVCQALAHSAQVIGCPVQQEILRFGGTDTAAIQRSRGGVPCGAVSIPTRYIHSPSEMCAISDVTHAAALLAHTACTI